MWTSTERSDFAAVKLALTICRGEHRSPVLRICCKFRIVGENFLLPNLVVTVGLFLRRANTVRPCSGFAVNSELSGRIFLLPNLVVAVGLLLRRANTVRPCSGFAVNSELSGRIFCCRTLLLPWAYYFDERTAFASAQDLL